MSPPSEGQIASWLKLVPAIVLVLGAILAAGGAYETIGELKSAVVDLRGIVTEMAKQLASMPVYDRRLKTLEQDQQGTATLDGSQNDRLVLIEKTQAVMQGDVARIKTDLQGLLDAANTRLPQSLRR